MVFSFHERNNSLRNLFRPDPWNDVSVHVQGLGFGSCSQALGWDGGAEAGGVFGLEKGVSHQSLSPMAPQGPWGPTVLSVQGAAQPHGVYPLCLLRTPAQVIPRAVAKADPGVRQLVMSQVLSYFSLL